MATLELFGAPLSQPFRAVAWTMLQLGVPFEMKMAIPGKKSSLGTLHESYQSLTGNRTALIPVLRHASKDGTTSLTVVESPSILVHLCEVYGGQTEIGKSRRAPVLYPAAGTVEKATIDSYLHWHHENTRFVAKSLGPKIRPDLNVKVTARDQKRFHAILTRRLDSGWLHADRENRPFIGGMATPTIADLLAYSEICAVTLSNLISLEQYPRLNDWAKRMTTVPFHDVAQKSVLVLGNMAGVEGSADMQKRIKKAVVAGLKAIGGAQARLAPIPKWTVTTATPQSRL